MTYTPTQAGFSLVETLVAMTILLIVVVGPMRIAVEAARATSFANEQTIAFFLAQEGAELAQKARDDILLANFSGTPDNDAWDDYTGTGGSFGDCFDDGSGALERCGLTIDDDAVGTVEVQNCTGSDIGNCRLNYDATAGTRSRYTHDAAGAQTIYTRTISLRQTANRDISVVSTVTWRNSTQNREQSAQVVTYLYNVYGF